MTPERAQEILNTHSRDHHYTLAEATEKLEKLTSLKKLVLKHAKANPLPKMKVV